MGRPCCLARSARSQLNFAPVPPSFPGTKLSRSQALVAYSQVPKRFLAMDAKCFNDRRFEPAAKRGSFVSVQLNRGKAALLGYARHELLRRIDKYPHTGY